MSTQSLTLSVQPKGKPFKNIPAEIEVPKAATTSEIYQQLATRIGTSVYRVRVTKGSDGSLIPNEKDVPVQQTGLLDGSKIYIKDLGPQIEWRTIFVLEYFGPLIIHPLIFQFRQYLYSNPAAGSPFPPPSFAQSLALLLVSLHFLKREFETLFVHRFSNASMPVSNIFKNCGHYWGLAGLLIAYFTYGPSAPSAGSTSLLLLIPGIALFVVGELGNLYVHLILRSLRRPGTKERQIPRGLGFGWVTCPNYFFEILAWVGMALVTQSWATAVALVVGTIQMYFWAKKKEMAYRREFGDKYKRKRAVIIPGFL